MACCMHTQLTHCVPLYHAVHRSRTVLTRYYNDVRSINSMEPAMRALGNKQLRAKTGEARRRPAGMKKSVEGERTCAKLPPPSPWPRFHHNVVLLLLAQLPNRPTAQPPNGRPPTLPPPPSEELKARVAAGAPLDSLRCEAFAVVREAARRVLGMRHYDCQLVGGMVLSEGAIAEMRTGG